MCGRFTLRSPASLVAEQFALAEMPRLEPRYNIAPTQPVAVLRVAPGAGAADRRLAMVRWGLIPEWAKDPSIGNRLINARAETVAEKPAFRSAFRHRRCLVVADGFYEWLKLGTRRQPYFFHLADDRPFGMAGLWESWRSPNGCPLETCTILTTEANECVRPVHERMPVILPPDAYADWLSPGATDARRLLALLTPDSAADLRARAVGAMVNDPRVDDPRCIEPA